jgi:hypothetical protein
MSVTQVFPSAISVTISVVNYLLEILHVCLMGWQVHDEGENIAMPRGKSSLAPSGNFNVSAIKQRAVLGDICSNRAALTNVVSEVDFKKPQHVPSKSVAKKQIQEIEK